MFEWITRAIHRKHSPYTSSTNQITNHKRSNGCQNQKPTHAPLTKAPIAQTHKNEQHYTKTQRKQSLDIANEGQSDGISAEEMRTILAELEKNWARNRPQAVLSRAWDCLSICSSESTFSCAFLDVTWAEETNEDLLHVLQSCATILEPREAWV